MLTPASAPPNCVTGKSVGQLEVVGENAEKTDFLPTTGAESRSVGAAVADLSHLICNPPTLTEAQIIQAIINELLNRLTAAGIIYP